MQNHDFAKLTSEIGYYKRPVYAYGANVNGNSAHAWVIDGYTNTDSYTKYTLYHLDRRAYPDFGYETAEGIDPVVRNYQNGLHYFHMNWGWGGSHNGWFTDDNISNPVGNYSKSRKEMYIKL